MGQFRHSAIYEWRGDPQTINHHIAHIRQLDIQVEQEIETLRKSGSKRTIWGVVLGLVGLILGVLVVPLILLFIGIPLFISGMMRSAEANKRNALDYDNKRYELVRRLLEVVGRELEWSEPVHLYMDLRPAELPQKVRGAYKLFDNFMGGMTQTNYQDDWLWLQGQLVDGTQFTATMAERARVRAGYKRGASGKLKHKTKRKSKHYLGLQLKVRPKKYPGVFGIAQRGHPAVQLPPYCQPKSLKTKRNTVRLMAVLPHPWQEPAPGAMLDHRPRGSTVFAMMFLSLYQMLNLAKEKQRAAARRAGAGA